MSQVLFEWPLMYKKQKTNGKNDPALLLFHSRGPVLEILSKILSRGGTWGCQKNFLRRGGGALFVW